MIKKIIVELEDTELTFQEFSTVADFMASDLFKTETATPVAPVEPTPEVAPEVTPETPVSTDTQSNT